MTFSRVGSSDQMIKSINNQIVTVRQQVHLCVATKNNKNFGKTLKKIERSKNEDISPHVIALMKLHADPKFNRALEKSRSSEGKKSLNYSERLLLEKAVKEYKKLNSQELKYINHTKLGNAVKGAGWALEAHQAKQKFFSMDIHKARSAAKTFVQKNITKKKPKMK